MARLPGARPKPPARRLRPPGGTTRRIVIVITRKLIYSVTCLLPDISCATGPSRPAAARAGKFGFQFQLNTANWDFFLVSRPVTQTAQQAVLPAGNCLLATVCCLLATVCFSCLSPFTSCLPSVVCCHPVSMSTCLLFAPMNILEVSDSFNIRFKLCTVPISHPSPWPTPAARGGGVISGK